MVVGLEVCGRGGGVWERWRCVREVEKCGGRGGGECERGGGEYRRGGDVWEGVKCVEGWRCVGRSEVCGRGGGVF